MRYSSAVGRTIMGISVGVAFSVSNAQDSALAIQDPDRFAWMVFSDINRPSDSDEPDGPVVWESWALARDVFLNPNSPPAWPEGAPAMRSMDDLEPEPLQQVLFGNVARDLAERSEFPRAPIPGDNLTFVDDRVLQTNGNETRLNRATFDFVVANELYNIEGQESFFQRGEKIDFPIEAREIKAQWRKIRPENASRYHTARVARPDGTAELWGLTALHITTKDLPNWFWATWEHRDNPGLNAVIPSVDTSGLPDALKGTKWENYILRGTQVDFVDSIGNPTLLANSQVERGFQDSSSCITCHARASIGPMPRIRFEPNDAGVPVPQPIGANRLSVFDGENGSIGIPDATWYMNNDTVPAARRYIQTDFVWSLFRARRKSATDVVSRTDSESRSMLQDAISRSEEEMDMAISAHMSESEIGFAEVELPELRVAVFLQEGERLPKNLLPSLLMSSVTLEENQSSDRFLTLLPPGVESLRESALSPSRFEVYRPPSLVEPTINLNAARNLDARISHNVPELQGTYGVSGRDVTAAVFDEGAVRSTHKEFLTTATDASTSRVAIRTTKPPSRHSTHVAGTMAAAGVNIRATGMAPALHLLSFDWENDLADLRSNASQFTISNHSYGPVCGWEEDQAGNWFWWGDRSNSPREDSKFGQYSANVAELDRLLYENPQLVSFVAAGNDRNDGPPMQPISHRVIGINPVSRRLEWQISTAVHEKDGFDNGGIDTIAGLGGAKNAICIGSIEDVTVSNPDIVMTGYSGWGPMDDGRIKPDLVANGDWLLSTSSVGDDAYVNMPGTSMASPTAAGIAALLQEQFVTRYSRSPLSSELKAILIHSARDAGVPGPDPIFGWGAIDALAAGHLIAGRNGESILNHSINEGGTITFSGENTGRPIRVTLVWLDPASGPIAGRPDNPAPALQNDLDVNVTDSDGAPHFPYSLRIDRPLEPASTSNRNDVDNIEVVDAAGRAGQWRVEVTGTDFAVGGKQAFTVIVSGLSNVQIAGG